MLPAAELPFIFYFLYLESFKKLGLLRDPCGGGSAQKIQCSSYAAFIFFIRKPVKLEEAFRLPYKKNAPSGALYLL
jgi:hypothetical protein